MSDLIIEAPVDGFVAEIAPAGAVTTGGRLVAMKSPQLERQKAGLLSAEEQLSFLELPFKDGRIDAEIAALAQKEKILKDAAAAQQAIYDTLNDQNHLIGGVDPQHLLTAQIATLQAQIALIDAHLASSHADRKKNDMLDKIASTKTKIDADQAYLEEMGNALTVLAARNGRFTPAISLGSFVRKGHELGTFSL